MNDRRLDATKRKIVISRVSNANASLTKTIAIAIAIADLSASRNSDFRTKV